MPITLFVVVIGGRVIPFSPPTGPVSNDKPPLRWLEVLSGGSMILLVVIAFADSPGTGGDHGTLCAGAALSTAGAFCAGATSTCWGIPLLWSLHLAYAFIPLGLVGPRPVQRWTIAQCQYGPALLYRRCYRGMILAMISRVTLGHRQIAASAASDDRRLCSDPGGAAVRVLVPTLLPAFSQWGIGIAGVRCGWRLYGIFVYHYWPHAAPPQDRWWRRITPCPRCPAPGRVARFPVCCRIDLTSC